MSDLKKSWQTTLIGVVILGGLAYKGFTVGFTVQDAVFGLVAIGFIRSKDASVTHSKNAKKKIDGDRPSIPPRE